MNETTNRTERRKLKTRDAIVATAIELFKQKSSLEVSFDKIAAKADVSRKTLYNHFSSKDQLIYEIIYPIFSDGSSYLDTISGKESVMLSDVWDLCLFLYNKYGNMMELLYSIDFEEHAELQNLHNSFMEKFMGICKRAADFSSDSKITCDKLALTIYKCYIPLISSVQDLQDRDSLFKNAMIGMVDGLMQK